ncbi:ribbon-helix-helix protein, CopG family [Halorubrum lacusprofundi]|uniref:ribbon-helix-helix protein, CopG family n=1 Tax=Halorubrum lacusprofundi TaxID=2247 RepID=UPI000B5A8CEB|nr:ribbon-helix-helix protein, CopG family [Halorubrum lacusprofundi]
MSTTANTTTTTVNLSVRVDTDRKAKLEALAHDYGNCSQSAIIRQYIEEQYHHVFGELDPEALASGHITDKQKHQIINGESPEDIVDRSFLLTPEDEDTKEGVIE